MIQSLSLISIDTYVVLLNIGELNQGVLQTRPLGSKTQRRTVIAKAEIGLRTLDGPDTYAMLG